MIGLKRKLLLYFMITLIISSNFIIIDNRRVEGAEPFFTLTLKIVVSNPYPDYAALIKQYLARIGINVNIIIEDWGSIMDTIISERDFDLLSLSFSGDNDPGPIHIYRENNSYNLFGYNETLDWDESLGAGKNEWMINEFYNIYRYNSQERIDHLWEWQNYLMEDIAPMLPLSVPLGKIAYFNNLKGYNFDDGIIQSWGKMYWDGLHIGQESLNEFVYERLWDDCLSPFCYPGVGDRGRFILDCCLDKLIWQDNNLTYWPHLVKEWQFLDNNHLRLKLRKGIKWSNDPDNYFSNEYLDTEDVYFTLYCWKEMFDYYNRWDFLDDMVIIDPYTIDLFFYDPIDYYNRNYVGYIADLNILPEHYLNQTQLIDDVTPDTTHQSWINFAEHPFGVGLFELIYNHDFDEDQEALLKMNPDSWWLNTSLTQDDSLEWNRRFGDFSQSPEFIRIVSIPDDLIKLQKFYDGKIDLFEAYQYKPTQEWMIANSATYQYFKYNSFYWIAFNLRENRGPIGSREPCPMDSHLTIGLAIRKAICHAIDRNEIIKIVDANQNQIHHYPLYAHLGKWLDPNIIKYDYNLNLAKEYMTIAGYPLVELTIKVPFYAMFGFIGIIGLIFLRKKKRVESSSTRELSWTNKNHR